MELEKLRLRPRQHAGVRRAGISGFAAAAAAGCGITMGSSVRRIVRTNKFGVTEIRLAACAICSVEVCDSTGCNKSRYEDFVRQLVEPAEDDKTKDGGAGDAGDEDDDRKLRDEKDKKEAIKSMKGQALKIKQAKKDQQLNRRLKKEKKALAG